MFSLSLAPWEVCSNPLKPTASTAATGHLGKQHHVTHGPTDSKRVKLINGNAVTSSHITKSSPNGNHNYSYSYDTTVTATKQPTIFTTTQTSASIETNTPSTVATIASNMTHQQQPPDASHRDINNNYNLSLRNVKHVSRTVDNKYIIISINDQIPTDMQGGKGRRTKIHHLRSDTTESMIDCILKHETSIDHNTKWGVAIQNNNGILKRSQRSKLDCLDNMLHQFSSNDVSGILKSYLQLQCNRKLCQELLHSLKPQTDSKMEQLLSNVSKCANNSSNHDKYKWVLPVVSVCSHAEAKSNGFNVGERVWTRASKLYKETKDVTAQTTRNTKVSVLVVCFVFMLCVRG